MTTMAEPNSAGPNKADLEREGKEPAALTVFAYLLAAAWLLLPAVQYVATYKRTELQLDASGLQEPLAFASLDFTPYYLLVVALTGVLIAMRYLDGRPAVPTETPTGQKAKGQPRSEKRS